jgi:hypothetical protein
LSHTIQFKHLPPFASLVCLQSGFARLASVNPYMHRVIARAGMPVAVFAPTNAALAAYLRQALPVNTSSSTDNGGSSRSSSSSSSSSSSWSQLLDAAAARPGSTILLLLRHSEYQHMELQQFVFYAECTSLACGHFKVTPLVAHITRYPDPVVMNMVTGCGSS